MAWVTPLAIAALTVVWRPGGRRGSPLHTLAIFYAAGWVLWVLYLLNRHGWRS